MIVAALYIDPRGPCPRMPDVDAWDAERDARLYDGPHPIVAHPPCGPWGRLRHLSKHDDPQLAVRAVAQVRACAGVLEHPAWSQLWRALRLPFPGELPDEHGGYTIEVAQCDFGHVARKRTWLYIVGVDPSALPPTPPPSRADTLDRRLPTARRRDADAHLSRERERGAARHQDVLGAATTAHTDRVRRMAPRDRTALRRACGGC